MRDRRDRRDRAPITHRAVGLGAWLANALGCRASHARASRPRRWGRARHGVGD